MVPASVGQNYKVGMNERTLSQVGTRPTMTLDVARGLNYNQSTFTSPLGEMAAGLKARRAALTQWDNSSVHLSGHVSGRRV